MTDVLVKGITKKFGKIKALDNITLNVNSGELLFLLGASGCGKTTLLRIIAGLETPDSGRIFFDSQDITDLDVNKRDVGFVFQQYALWPHMTVRENILYPLDVRKLNIVDKNKRLDKVLENLQLKGYEERYPHELSGGQQQRVALGRVLIFEPKVILLDEPLSNLDEKLKNELRLEIRRLNKELKITSIYISHDTEEALSIADRIVLIDKGEIIQEGSPRKIYYNPLNLKVSGFFGDINLIDCIVNTSEDNLKVQFDGTDLLSVAVDKNDSAKKEIEKEVNLKSVKDRVTIGIKPEGFIVGKHNEAETGDYLKGVVKEIQFFGKTSKLKCLLSGKDKKNSIYINITVIESQLSEDLDIQIGTELMISYKVKSINVFS